MIRAGLTGPLLLLALAACAPAPTYDIVLSGGRA